MKLKALKPLLYGGRTISEGEEFEAFSPLHERTLVAVRKAVLIEEGSKPKAVKAKTKAEAEEVETDELPPAKAVEAKSTAKDTVGSKGKTYQTRKLTAEDE